MRWVAGRRAGGTPRGSAGRRAGSRRRGGAAALVALGLAGGLPGHAARPPAELGNETAAPPARCGAEDGDPTVAAARCWYAVGRYDRALEVLQAPGIEREAADDAVLVILLARAGRPEAARAALAAAEARHGPGDARLRARLVLRLASGDAGAWDALDAALAARPGAPQLVLAASEMTALQPDAATPGARAAVGREEGAMARYNGAALRWESGDWAGCGDGVDEALALLADAPDMSLEHRLLGLGHRCAVGGADLARANALLTRMGPAVARTAVDPGALVRHAQLLGEAGAPGAGARLLGLRPTVEPALQPTRDSVELRLRREAGDLDGALKVARGGAASAGARANLARALHEAGRSTEARALLSGACPDLRGTDRRACEQYRAHLEGR